ARPLHGRRSPTANDACLRAALARGARAYQAHRRSRGAMPDVLFVATGEDVRADGLSDVPCMVPLVNRDGTPRHDTPRPVLALGKVRHVGQPVALVVAETLTAARDAAEAIEVEYDPLPAVKSQDHHGTRPRRTCDAACHRRRGDRVSNCDFVAGPLIALAASRLALRAPRRGGGFGHDPAPVTAHNAPFPSYKNRPAKTKSDGGERCETNWSFLRSCLGC